MSYDILEDFDNFEQATHYCRNIVYKVDELDEEVRVRIQAGRFGYDQVVTKAKYDEIKKWLWSINAVKVSGTVSKELFFA